MVNNGGDSFDSSDFSINTKLMKRNVLDYYGMLNGHIMKVIWKVTESIYLIFFSIERIFMLFGVHIPIPLES